MDALKALVGLQGSVSPMAEVRDAKSLAAIRVPSAELPIARPMVGGDAAIFWVAPSPQKGRLITA